MNGRQLERVSELKYLEFVLSEPGTDEAECCRKVASARKDASADRSLVNARSLKFEYVPALHQGSLVPILMYGRRY